MGSGLPKRLARSSLCDGRRALDRITAMHASHSTHSRVRLCRCLSYEGPLELRRGEALTGRAAAFVRGLNWVVVAGALVPPRAVRSPRVREHSSG
jgi:hypothetical protein